MFLPWMKISLPAQICFIGGQGVEGSSEMGTKFDNGKAKPESVFSI
jgi:hypothetical protein